MSAKNIIWAEICDCSQAGYITVCVYDELFHIAKEELCKNIKVQNGMFIPAMFIDGIDNDGIKPMSNIKAMEALSRPVLNDCIMSDNRKATSLPSFKMDLGGQTYEILMAEITNCSRAGFVVARLNNSVTRIYNCELSNTSRISLGDVIPLLKMEQKDAFGNYIFSNKAANKVLSNIAV